MLTYPQARWDRRYVNGSFVWSSAGIAVYRTLGPGAGGALIREVQIELVSTSGTWQWFYSGWVLSKTPVATYENYMVGQPLIAKSITPLAGLQGLWRTRAGQGTFTGVRFGVDVSAPEGAWYILYLGQAVNGIDCSVLMSIGYDVWDHGPAVVVAGDAGGR